MHFKSISNQSAVETPGIMSERAKACARSIVKEFVRQGSDRQVNLGSSVRQQIEADVAHDRITPITFDRALNEIKSLMSKDSFRRYKRSDLCKQYLAVVRERSGNKNRNGTIAIGNVGKVIISPAISIINSGAQTIASLTSKKSGASEMDRRRSTDDGDEVVTKVQMKNGGCDDVAVQDGATEGTNDKGKLFVNSGTGRETA